MKSIIIFIGIILLLGCGPHPAEEAEMQQITNVPSKVQTDPKSAGYARPGYARIIGQFPYNDVGCQMVVVEADECEYIAFNGYNRRGLCMTHKGNCKYCEERFKRWIDEGIQKYLTDGTRYNGIQEGR